MSEGLKDRIEELERKHRVVADNLLDAIWVVDVETLKFEYITPSIEQITGYTADEFMNFTIMDRLTPESFQKVQSILARDIPRFEKGEKGIRKLEVEIIHKNGDIHWSEIKAKFVKEAGKPLKVVGVTREITERKKADQEQKDLITKLEDALAEKEKLLKEVSLLRGLLPTCSGCKRIRDDQGKWWPLDAYVDARTEAELTHTICPGCKDVFYSDLK